MAEIVDTPSYLGRAWRKIGFYITHNLEKHASEGVFLCMRLGRSPVDAYEAHCGLAL
jgi:hypothetical protein